MATERSNSPASGDEMSGTKAGVFSQNMVLLPEKFEPGEFDVICGRGRKCFNHVGNARFRELVTSYLEKYRNAAKLEKSYILSDIVNKVRQESPTGGFVKKDPLSGRWHEVGDFLAREKTSQAFRDALHDQYKSSNTAKKKRRQAEQAEKLYRDHSQRSLGLDDNSTHSEQTYASNTSGKFMRVDRLDGTQDSLLGALDKDIAAQFGGVENSRKLFASQKSARSVLDVGQLSSGAAPPWFNRSCPNLNNINMDSMTLHSESETDSATQQTTASESSWTEHPVQIQVKKQPRPMLRHPGYMRHSQPNLFAPKLGQIDEGGDAVVTNIDLLHQTHPAHQNVLAAFPPIEERKELLSPQAGMTLFAGMAQPNLASSISPLPLSNDSTEIGFALGRPNKSAMKASLEDANLSLPLSPIGDGSSGSLFEKLAAFVDGRAPHPNLQNYQH